MWSEEWLGGQSRSGVENGTDGWLRRRDTGRGYWNSNMRRRWSWPGYWREVERRDPGDLCKAELKGLGDCLEWAGGKSQDWGSSSVLGGPSDLSSIIGQNGPRDALCSSLFQLQPSESAIQLPWASRACQHHFLSLVLHYQLAVSSQIHQSCYTKMEATISLLVNMPLQNSHTSLSLGSFEWWRCSSGGRGSFFHKLFKKRYQVPLKRQNRYNGWTHFREVQKPPHDEGG